MDVFVFLFLFAMTIMPSLIEIQLINRQIQVILATGKDQDSFASALHPQTFLECKMFALNGNFFHLFQVTFIKMFLVSLELCFGLLPVLWKKAESIVSKPTMTIQDEVFVSINFALLYFSYEYAKFAILKLVKDFVVQQKFAKQKIIKAGLLCTVIFKYIFGVICLVPVCFAIVITGNCAREHFYLWLWVYSCLCVWVYFLFVWPFCVLPLMYKLMPIPRGELRKRIKHVALHFNFPHREILVGKHNLCKNEKYKIAFADVCCLKRIVIDENFFPREDFTFDSKLVNDALMVSTSGSIWVDSQATTTQDNNLGNMKAESGEEGVSNKELDEQSKMELEIEEEIATNKMEEEEPAVEQAVDFNYKTKSERFLMEQQDFSNDNVVALVIHELALWKHYRRLLKIIVFNIFLLLWFVFLRFTIKWPAIYVCVGFAENSHPFIAGFVIVLAYLSGPMFMLSNFVFNMLIRYQTFKADECVVKMGYAEPLIEALDIIYMRDVKFPFYDKWYARNYHAMPRLLERLAYLDADAILMTGKKMKQKIISFFEKLQF